MKYLDNDYSIYYRHPIDVLTILTTLHRVIHPSRTSAINLTINVLEAQWVLETEDLSQTNTGNINFKGQIYDDQRPMDTGDINPISRTRIRHVGRHDTKFEIEMKTL